MGLHLESMLAASTDRIPVGGMKLNLLPRINTIALGIVSIGASHRAMISFTANPPTPAE